MMSADQLTDDTWKQILCQLSMVHRLRCRVLSSRFNSLATAATDSIAMVLEKDGARNQLRAESLDSYLQHYGSYATSMALAGLTSLRALPCAHLRSLEVCPPDNTFDEAERRVTLQWEPSVSDGTPGVLDVCRQLTRLQLERCSIEAATATSLSALSKLSVLVGLQDLQLRGVWQSFVHARFPGSVVLPHLKHLTCLHLSSVAVEGLHAISSLNLSVLHLQPINAQPVALLPDIAPGFALPAALCDLFLGSKVAFDPALLSGTVGLTRLVLSWTRLLTGGGRCNGESLLAVIGGFQKLQVLELNALSEQGLAWPPPSAAYAALTASSKLQRLELFCIGMPHGVWSYVFPADRVCGITYYRASEWQKEWGVEDVSCLVKYCPRIREIDQLCVRGGSAPVAALAPLTALTRMHLGITTSPDDVTATIKALGRLTTLSHLYCRLSTGTSPAMRVVDALPLTALRQLTYFHLFSSMPTPPHRFTFDSKVDKPCWQQLEELCLAKQQQEEDSDG